MATPRKSPYAKFWSRYEAAVAEALCTPDPSERQLQRVQELAERDAHWQRHEQDVEDCPYCREYGYHSW